jgi:predicted NAD-dependent protein-ADP-ribosyltransferase YbiA (DUF1768 family)
MTASRRPVPADNRILYFARDREQFGFLSHFHPELAQLLLDTGQAELVEDSLSEPFWGIGPDGSGSNWAGRVLMEIREEMKRRG